MKTRNIIISALIVVVLVQFFFIIKLYKQKKAVFNELVQQIENTSYEVVVENFADALNQNQQASFNLLSHVHWALRHLGKCIELLESERGLEPIQIESPFKSLSEKPYKPPMDSNSVRFLIPYKKPKQLKFSDKKEFDLIRKRFHINLDTTVLLSAVKGYEIQIENYQKRLQRLDPNNNPSIDKP